MTPLIFAAAMTVIVPSGALPPGARLPDPSTLPLAQRTAMAAGACAKLETQTVAPDGVPLLKRLDQLPWAQLEHAVWRSVNGCPVREIVFGGQTYYVTSNAPRVERLDPVARQPLEQRFGF